MEKQCSDICGKLHHNNLKCATVKIKIRWSDFSTITRQSTLSTPSNRKEDIYQIAISLLDSNWHASQPIRLIGVGVSGLANQARQLHLWDYSENTNIKNDELQSIIQDLRSRFGEDAIKRGTDLKR
jgi:DNA polymerase-4